MEAKAKYEKLFVCLNCLKFLKNHAVSIFQAEMELPKGKKYVSIEQKSLWLVGNSRMTTTTFNSMVKLIKLNTKYT